MALLISNVAFPLVPLLLLLTPGVKSTGYWLRESYSGKDFFDGFDFFTDPDPTHGFVTYVDRDTATGLGIAVIKANGAAHMGVDTTTILNPNGPGRKSVRITSKKSWNHGLFISDIEHMPGGICGTWPALWTLGEDWPNHGEIDIIEGVNSQRGNIMSLHTSPGCTVAGDLQRGTLQTSNCDANVNFNSGCGSSSVTKGSYGDAFNRNGGGVFAMEWTSDYIRVWFFRRYSIPADILVGKPDPDLWGLPEANFQGDCDIDKKFKDHKLIFDTTFCGDWGNAVWSSDEICKNTAPTCTEFVAGNPAAFVHASWTINYVKVFELHETSSSTGYGTSPSSASACTKICSASSTESQSETSEPSTSSEDFPTASIQLTDFPEPSNFPLLTSNHPFAVRDSLFEDGTELFSLAERETDHPSPEILETRISPSVILNTVTTQSKNWGLPTESVDPCESATTTTNTSYATLSTSKTPASEFFAYGMGGGPRPSQYYTKVVTTTYVDTCDCEANTLTTHTITSTISLCSCFHPNPFTTNTEPQIPMYTTKRLCGACGEESVVTVTIPYPEITTTEEPTVFSTAKDAVSYLETAETGDASAYTNDGVVYLEANEGGGLGSTRRGWMIIMLVVGVLGFVLVYF